MDFIDQLKVLGEKIQKQKDQISTEEATKNAFILPFLNYLGYDVFNPSEVLPEFVADLGTKKGEKVDYAILQNGEPIIIIECKWHGEKLDPHNSQLFRYFHVTKARFSILTNGIIYQFFTDLEEANKMDSKPFLEIDLSNINELAVQEIKKFHKTNFNIEEILSTASELKYCKAIKNTMIEEFNKPSDEFAKLFIKQIIFGKPVTAKLIEQFSPMIKKAFNQLISETISDRLKLALSKENQIALQQAEGQSFETVESKEISPKSLIVTTEEEMEGFYIIKSILRQQFDVKRLKYKDTVNYFNILLDGSVKKPICRLWLNGKKKYISLFDTLKEEKLAIEAIDELYNFEENFKTAISNYENNLTLKAKSPEEAQQTSEEILLSN